VQCLFKRRHSGSVALRFLKLTPQAITLLLALRSELLLLVALTLEGGGRLGCALSLSLAGLGAPLELGAFLAEGGVALAEMAKYLVASARVVLLLTQRVALTGYLLELL